MTFSAIARASAAALFVSLAAFALPSYAQDYSLLNYTGADRDAKLQAAARKEGGLTLYTSIAEKDLPPLREAFEKKYGIKLTVWRAGSDKVLQRSLTETGAKRYEVDAIHIGAPEMEALHREQVLQPVTSPVFKNLMVDAVPKHKDYASTMLTVWVQAYNTNLIKKEDLPKSYEDLLNPKWKGKLGIEAEDADWFATAATGMGEAKGVKLFRDIAATNGISVRKGHSLLTNLIAAGEVPLGLTVYNYMPTAVAKKGAPIASFVIEPAIARANAVGIARHAPHPASAVLFYDFLIGPEGQKILASLDYVPTNTTVPSPMKGTKIKVEDPVLTLDGMEKWTKLYNEMLQGK